MSLFTWMFLGWLFYRLVKAVVARMGEPNAGHPQPESESASASSALAAVAAPARQYAFEPRQNWALMLAHPMAHPVATTAASPELTNGFSDPEGPPLTPQAIQALRSPLLHLFGLRSDMSDAQVHATLTPWLRKHWFKLDLDHTRPSDDPRAAMAFACGRVAFAVRTAGMLGWLDHDTQWLVLYQNAQRAHDCFKGWQDFGCAWAQGRRQWVAGSRADSLCKAFDEDQVARWVADATHPWQHWPWDVPPLFVAPT